MNKRRIQTIFLSLGIMLIGLHVHFPCVMAEATAEGHTVDISFVRRELVNHITMAIKSIKKIPEDVVTGDEKRALEEYLMSLHDKFDAHQIDSNKITIIINWYYKNILFNYLQSGAVHEVRIHMGLFIEYLKTLKAIEDLTTKQMEDEFEKNAVVERDVLRKKLLALEHRLGWINDDPYELKRQKLRRYMTGFGLLIIGSIIFTASVYAYKMKEGNTEGDQPSPTPSPQLSQTQPVASRPRGQGIRGPDAQNNNDPLKSLEKLGDQNNNREGQAQSLKTSELDTQRRDIQLAALKECLGEERTNLVATILNDFWKNSALFVGEQEKSIIDQQFFDAALNRKKEAIPNKGAIPNKRGWALKAIMSVPAVVYGSAGFVYNQLGRFSKETMSYNNIHDIADVTKRLQMVGQSYMVDEPRIAKDLKQLFLEGYLKGTLAGKGIIYNDILDDEEHYLMNELRKLYRDHYNDIQLGKPLSEQTKGGIREKLESLAKEVERGVSRRKEYQGLLAEKKYDSNDLELLRKLSENTAAKWGELKKPYEDFLKERELKDSSGSQTEEVQQGKKP